jgi:Uma2 family endonuclease
MAEAGTKRWTLAEIEALPYDEWTRYEIVDGELFVSTAPGDHHQAVCIRGAVALSNWNDRTGLGVVRVGPGLVFSDFDAVIPDIVWMSRERFGAIWRDDKLRGAPELVVEVLSPGAANERRDRQTKLKLYGEWGVDEFWLVDWRALTVDVYRRGDAPLSLVGTLGAQDTLTSPLLPGFSLVVGRLFDWP